MSHSAVPHFISERAVFMEMTDDSCRAIRSITPIVNRELPLAFDKLYARIRKTPETLKFFASEGQMARAKGAQTNHWENIANGDFNSDYAAKVQTIGTVHARIGLEPRWYIGGYAIVLDHLINAALDEICPKGSLFSKKTMPPAAFGQALGSLAKAVFLDMDIAISIYLEEAEKARQKAQADAIAAELRSSADNMSRRTEQRASSIEETALDEITTTVKDTSRRAEKAGQLVGKTKARAEHSSDVVRQAVAAMGAIEASSKEISSIIDVIDSIAFQTNLLALNAGVEAARAGDTGQGFAVVAQEVRELARRSAKAAREIGTLIETSTGQVTRGVELVGETGRVLTEIAGDVQEINQHIAAIVDAAREQSTGLQEVNSAVNAIDQTTQQNAAMAEQSTAATHAFAGEPGRIAGMLAAFRITRAEASPQARRPNVLRRA